MSSVNGARATPRTTSWGPRPREVTTATRKPQARSLETRRRLRDATLDTIVEVGLPRASTPKINRRAGVSNGAQQHHFPTRSELVAAALEELTARFTSQIEQLVARDDARLSLVDFFRLIASTAPAHERYRLCWVEAMVAARTDPDLAEVMRPLDQAKTDRWRDIAARLASADPDLAADLAELNTYLVRGFVVQRGVHDGADFERLFDLWCDMVEATLARSGSAESSG